MRDQISQLVSPFLEQVRPTGENGIRATCPLCGSQRAFVLNGNYGSWMCWSCHESGSLTSFLYRVARFTSKQVDRALENTHFAPRISDKARARATLREGWVTLPEYILSAYEWTPGVSSQESIPWELDAAGFGTEILKEFDVGIDSENGRIVFPIRDVRGQLAAISGRARYEQQVPRYKVYDANPAAEKRKQGELYGVVAPFIPDNRKHLYGLDTVYPKKFFNPEDTSPIILTEGYKSTLWLRQMGYDSALGLQGSSLTPQQQRFLTRLRGPYYVMLDNEPGKSYPDKFGHCAGVDILRALGRSGKALLCSYNNKPLRTAPDDLNIDEVAQMIDQAQTIGQLQL